MIDPALEAAFRATAYWVADRDGRRFAIRIDSRCERLDDLLDAAGTMAWAYVTACNPRSQLLDDEENRLRMERLETVVRGRGFVVLPGEALADEPGWPAERSLLVLGIPESEAVEIASTFAQHAIVVGTAGSAARLVWIRRTAGR
jgi:hypothetical protein